MKEIEIPDSTTTIRQMTDDLRFLSTIIIKASELINDEFDIKEKDNEGDLVTSVDLKIEQYLISEIQRNYPEFSIISEEYNDHVKTTENCFIIDPIDGSINFANKMPLWGIQAACVRDGKICASVIYLVALDELYEADKHGAYLNGKRIEVNAYGINRGICDIEGPNKRKNQDIINKFRHTRNINSTAVAFAWVATGRLSAGAYLKQDKIWDYVPGEFLVEQAGGKSFDEGGAYCSE